MGLYVITITSQSAVCLWCFTAMPLSNVILLLALLRFAACLISGVLEYKALIDA